MIDEEAYIAEVLEYRRNGSMFGMKRVYFWEWEKSSGSSWFEFKNRIKNEIKNRFYLIIKRISSEVCLL